MLQMNLLQYFALSGFATMVLNKINTSGGWLFPPTVDLYKNVDLSCVLAHLAPSNSHCDTGLTLIRAFSLKLQFYWIYHVTGRFILVLISQGDMHGW
jgi:hypothetical protein